MFCSVWVVKAEHPPMVQSRLSFASIFSFRDYECWQFLSTFTGIHMKVVHQSSVLHLGFRPLLNWSSSYHKLSGKFNSGSSSRDLLLKPHHQLITAHTTESPCSLRVSICTNLLPFNHLHERSTISSEWHNVSWSSFHLINPDIFIRSLLNIVHWTTNWVFHTCCIYFRDKVFLPNPLIPQPHHFLLQKFDLRKRHWLDDIHKYRSTSDTLMYFSYLGRPARGHWYCCCC